MTSMMTDALRAQWGSEGEGIALLYTPDEAMMARVLRGPDGTTLLEGPNGELDVDRIESAFEIIAFSKTRQVRVWRAGQEVRTGQVTCSSAGHLECRTSHQLLWGFVGEIEQGWASLQGSQVGTFHVPAPKSVAPGRRLALLVHECLDSDRHGNVGVARSRFTGLAVAGGSQ